MRVDFKENIRRTYIALLYTSLSHFKPSMPYAVCVVITQRKVNRLERAVNDLHTRALDISVVAIDGSFQLVHQRTSIFLLPIPRWTRLWAGNVYGIRSLRTERDRR
jgi:hypothetical protein